MKPSISGEAAAIKGPARFGGGYAREHRDQVSGKAGAGSAPGSALATGASARRAGWRAVALPWLEMLIPLRFWHTCLSSSLDLQPAGE